MATAILAAVACTNAPKADEKACENEGNKMTFNAQHFPKQGVDVNAFSGGVQHIGVPTANVQGTVEFYKTLGFEEVMRRTVTGDRDFAFMKLGNLLIEVIPNDKPTMRAGAVDHICLNVTKIEELYKKIKDAGYKMIDQNIVDIAFWEKGARYFFIEGPNKERIEFCEIVK